MFIGAFCMYQYMLTHMPKPEPEKIYLTVDGNKSEEPRQAVKINTADKTVRTFSYVPKEIVNNVPEKTDVQLETNKNIVVKVNGKEHEIKPTIQESQKFEKGKLVVSETATSNITITAPQKSKWSATYLYGYKDHSHGIGLGYNLTNDVTINAMYVNNTPYVGVTFQIGDMKSRKLEK